MINKTTHFEFLMPDGEEKVRISDLNTNMDMLDNILYDIYSKLPTPPPAYTIPFEIPASWYADYEIGGDTAPLIAKDSSITNFTAGNTYKLTLYDVNNNSYVATAQAENNGGIVAAVFSFAEADLPQSILDLFYQGDPDIAIMNNVLPTLEPGDGFVVFITTDTAKGTDADDMKAAISKYYLEENI